MKTIHFPHQQIGEFSVTALSDGYLTAGLDLLSNITPQAAAQLQQDAGISRHESVHINSYLVRGRGRTILIDAGAGGIKQWGGNLTAHLARAGVRPESIDTVLLTHAHPDHIGGLIDSAGQATFPAAELVVHQHEVAFWQDEGQLSRASERARGNFLLARQVFARYRPQMRTFTADAILPGISAVALPGHTAGHCGYHLESGRHSALVWGDIVHFPAIQIARPEVSIAFDMDPALAARTRASLLDRVAADGTLIAGMHLDERGFVRIERAGQGWQISAER